MDGGAPSLIFGWAEAVTVLALSIISGLLLFLPRDMYLVPVGWTFVGGFSIAVIALLRNLAQQLAAVNERQRLLFRELQHRVANSLQSVIGT
jgi:hypothetical protein